MHNTKKVILAFLAMVIAPLASANAGIPMLFLAMPAFLLSLVPIIVIEAFYLSKSLRLAWGQSLKTASVANLVSTLVGIPLTWFLLAVIQLVTGGGVAYGLDSALGRVLAVTWQAPWLLPYEGDLNWMLPIAGLVLLFPFFLVSWWSEYLVTKRMNKALSPLDIKRKVRNANLITYTLLTAWPLGLWVVAGASILN